MKIFLVVLHVMTCLILIVVVLLQRGKGAEIGAVFGSGASSTVFGARGPANFLTRLTTAAAIIFMITSLTLSYLATSSLAPTLFEEEGTPAAESAPAPGDAEEAPFVEVEPTPGEAGGSPFAEVEPAPAPADAPGGGDAEQAAPGGEPPGGAAP